MLNHRFQEYTSRYLQQHNGPIFSTLSLRLPTFLVSLLFCLRGTMGRLLPLNPKIYQWTNTSSKSVRVVTNSSIIVLVVQRCCLRFPTFLVSLFLSVFASVPPPTSTPLNTRSSTSIQTQIPPLHGASVSASKLCFICFNLLLTYTYFSSIIFVST